MGLCSSKCQDYILEKYCVKCRVPYSYYTNREHASRNSCKANVSKTTNENGPHTWSEPLFN